MKSSKKIQITQKMVDNLDYDTAAKPKQKITTNNGDKPMAMFIFHQSDIDAAIYFLTQSLEDPLNEGAIKCVFVQESCVERFTEKLKFKLKPYSKDALGNVNFLNSLKKSSEIISKLNAKTIFPTKLNQIPIVVYDIPQEHFTAGGPSPVVSLYTFRTVKEAVALSKKEKNLKITTIWSENHATAYEIVATTAFSEYYINCCNVGWTAIEEYILKKQPYSVVENSYHYETLLNAGILKSVVFPFGTTFAN